MSTATVPISESSALPPPYPMRKFSVDEYHRMIDADVLTDDSAVELLEGWIVSKMTHRPAHSITIEKIVEALRPRLPKGMRLRIQSPITTPDSEPEPDIAVVRGSISDHVSRHPSPAETPLVIEVSDSTLEQDRGQKSRLYARAGIAAYWIVNLIDRQIEVQSAPSGATTAPSYGSRLDYQSGETVPLVIEGHEVGHIAVDDLLP